MGAAGPGTYCNTKDGQPCDIPKATMPENDVD